MGPVHMCGPLAESMVSGRIRKKLKCAVVYLTTSGRRERARQMVLKKGTSALYKIFFIIQCQKFMKIVETFHISFLNTFIRYLILSLTLLFWSQRAMVFGFRRWWVKCVLLMEILQITAVFLALVPLPGKGNVYLIG